MVEKDEGDSFGVDQFDNIGLGKLLPGSIGLFYGPSGTGKSSMLAHFLFKGASGDNNVCLITGVPPATAGARMTRFRSYNQNWLRDGYISVLNLFDLMDLIGVDLSDLKDGDTSLIHDLLIQIMDHLDAKRLVIDPVNILVEALEKDEHIGFFQTLKDDLQRRDAHFMMAMDTDLDPSIWECSSFPLHHMDLVIRFRKESEPPLILNTMAIETWRSTPHAKTSFAIDISEDGVVLVPRIKPLEVR